MHYKPGLHILAEFSTPDAAKLNASACSRIFFDDIVNKYALQKVGEVYHDFDGGGFTAVVCLTESHLVIHTWPEYKLATFDVFLSNFRQENDDKVRGIFDDVLKFYEGTALQLSEIKR